MAEATPRGVTVPLVLASTGAYQQQWKYDATHYAYVAVDVDDHLNFQFGNRVVFRPHSASIADAIWRDVGLRVVAQGDDGANGGTFIGVQNAYSDADQSAEFDGYKARGTMAAPTAILAGDRILRLGALGYDGTALFYGGSFDFLATDAYDHTTNAGTYAALRLTGTGTRSIFTNYTWKNSVFTIFRNTGLNEFLSIGWGGTEWDIIADKSGGGSARILGLASYSSIDLYSGGVAGSNLNLSVKSTGSVVIGNAALATNAVAGFLYIPTCAGTPTGTPTAFTGRAALVIDSNNHKLYFYDSAWRDAGP